MKRTDSTERYFGLSFISTASDTNGRYFSSVTTLPPGDSGPPPHVHGTEDEGFYILEGEVAFTVDETKVRLRAGEFLNVERGERHTWRNDTASDARMHVTFTPAGIEEMFVELDEPGADVVSIGRKYGTEFFTE